MAFGKTVVASKPTSWQDVIAKIKGQKYYFKLETNTKTKENNRQAGSKQTESPKLSRQENRKKGKKQNHI